MNFRSFGISVAVLFVLAVTGGLKSPGFNTQGQAGRPAGRLTQPSKTLLWEISGNGLSRPSYLFGTLHVLCDSTAAVGENLRGVIEKADRICLEIDLDDSVQLMGVFKYMRMNGGEKLSELLSPDEFSRLEEFFRKHRPSIPFSMMNRFKPFFISAFIGEQLLPCPVKKSMEQLILEVAREKNKEIIGLETVAFQAGLFDSIPYKEQARELLQYLDSFDVYNNITLEMVRVYMYQDLAKLDILMKESDPSMKNYLDLLLYNRNRLWAEKMPGLMKENSLLFAVGAGHLVGEKGVIRLLQQKGYTVKPMEYKW